MSSIDRLLLYGIRSFGPDDRDKAVIKFSSPLTLILGQNGCGKTTIIEALKYATCGELPGGTDGGSGFVHDPKLSGCIDIKGHVRLKCNNTKGEEVTVSRTVLVTQKTRKLEFKSLDATITNADGKSMSGRCADVDGLMSNNLGVSKAVLTNVIFCHQEDSGWPLERGKKMKERFDAIFGITEYNKCLDHMRQLAKKMDTEKALLKKDVDHDAQTWEETQGKRKKLEDTKTKLAASCDSVASFDKQLTPLESKLQEILQKEMNFVTHYTKVQNIKSKKQYLTENVRDLKRNIETEFFGSKEELVSRIENFKQELDEKERKLQTLIGDKDTLIQDENRLQKNISAKQMLLGNLQNEEKQNQKTIEMRNLNMNKLADELKLTIISSCDINESSTTEKLASIEQKLKQENKAFEKSLEEKEQEEKKVQSEIDATREEKVRLEHDIQAKNKAIRDNESETKKVQNEIEEVDKSAETLANLERNLKEVNTRLEEVVKSLDVNDHKNRIKNNIEERNRLEEKLAVIDKEIKALQKYSVEKASLDQLNERKRKRDEDFKSLLNKHTSTLRHLLREVPECDFRKKVESYLDKVSNEIKTTENNINAKEKELTILSEKKRTLEEQLKAKQRQLATEEDRIDEVCGSEDLHSFLSNLKTKIESAQYLKGTLTSSDVMFKRYVDKLKSEDPLCPLCRRTFDSNDDVNLVIEDLNNRLREIPNNLKQTNTELDGLLERQSRALQLLSVFDNISRARENEIPKLKKDVGEMNKKIDGIKEEIVNWKNELIEPQTDKAMAKNLLSDAMQMDHIYQELRKLQQEINVQEKKLPATGINKTLQQANDEQDEMKSKLTEIRKQLESDQNALSVYNEKLSRLREQRNDITSKQMKIEGGVQQRKALTEKLDDLQMMADILQDELNEAKNKLNPVTERLAELTVKLRKMKTENKMKTDEGRKRLVELDKKLHELKNLQTAIEEYIKKGGHARLEKIRNELQELQLEKDRNHEQRTRMEKEIDSIKQFRHTQQVKKLDLENNLLMRDKQENISNLEIEIAELEGQLGELNVENLKRQKEEIKKQRDNLERQKSLAEGRQMELRNAIRDNEYELNSDRYKNAEKQYKKSVVGLKVLTLAIDDLKQYEKAMDWAMIYFHKERMKTINSIIRDLWRQIYCGNDIDTIEVKTDETTPTASGRRNYNYRVVQLKNGTELDMPGRCSAGQKVLACLIIRMALAETFSKNCGILALDEPTTNLDRENIESLSIALAEIVQKRMIQKNFQLLIITHDEEFLRRLTRVDKVDYFLQVQRNPRGKSEVKKIKI